MPPESLRPYCIAFRRNSSGKCSEWSDLYARQKEVDLLKRMMFPLNCFLLVGIEAS